MKKSVMSINLKPHSLECGTHKVFLIALFLFSLSFIFLGSVFAQTAVSNEKLDDGGINSGFLHDVDVWFDRILQSDLENREERVAEIKTLIEEGRIEEAKKLLELYREFADSAEKEILPEDEEEAKESSERIREALEEIASEIPDEEKENFDAIKEQEERIEKAGAIASKIKELCNELAILDPVQYENMCSVDDSTPLWRKKQHSELTKEQEKEMRTFGKIMSQCFKDPEICRCNDISIKSFADRCTIVAPLAVQCEKKGDESACAAMEEATQGINELLPEYLQEVMEEIEEEFSRDRFDLHMPQECVEAGAKTPEDCRRAMIVEHAPEECRDALLAQSAKNEKEARTICEEIMFKENAPEECIEAGITNHKECGKFMFTQNAPQECIDAGLTGEKQSDHKKCQKIMERLRGEENGEHDNRGRFNDGDCRRIENSEERLQCYDGALSDAGEFRKGDSQEHNKRNFPQPCREAGALTPEACGEVMRRFGEEKQQEGFEERSGKREEGFSEEERRRFEEENRNEAFRNDETREGEGGKFTESLKQTDGGLHEGSSESESINRGPSGDSSSSGSSGSGSPSVTGQIIFDNEFLDYYFK